MVVDLPRAVRTEEAEDLAPSDLKVETVQRKHGVAVGLAQTLGSDCDVHRVPHYGSVWARNSLPRQVSASAASPRCRPGRSRIAPLPPLARPGAPQANSNGLSGSSPKSIAPSVSKLRGEVPACCVAAWMSRKQRSIGLVWKTEVPPAAVCIRSVA